MRALEPVGVELDLGGLDDHRAEAEDDTTGDDETELHGARALTVSYTRGETRAGGARTAAEMMAPTMMKDEQMMAA